jgi:hypothetical protein
LARRSRLLLDPKWIAKNLSRFLGGCAAYFGFGKSATRFGKIRRYAQLRLVLCISTLNRRSRELGWSVVGFQSPDQLGLSVLSGIVVDPRPFQDGGEGPIPAVNGVGEPCAENRTHGSRRRGLESGQTRPRTHWDGTSNREPAATKASGP